MRHPCTILKGNEGWGEGYNNTRKKRNKNGELVPIFSHDPVSTYTIYKHHKTSIGMPLPVKVNKERPQIHQITSMLPGEITCIYELTWSCFGRPDDYFLLVSTWRSYLMLVSWWTRISYFLGKAQLGVGPILAFSVCPCFFWAIPFFFFSEDMS